jgi:predicted DsbA family dithiol-disulfide isomerase
VSEPTDPDAVRVFVYFDYSCPYSYLAVTLLETAATPTPLRVVWRPLETRSEIGAQGLSKAPVDAPSGAAGEVEGSADPDWSELGERAAELGVPLYRPEKWPDTRAALQASEFARDLSEEAHRRLHRAIFRAHFVRRMDIGRVDHLLRLATEEGIDTEALAAALEDGRYLEELARTESEAERYGIRQTPVFLFGRFKVVGAAPAEVLLEAARRAVVD